jgi:hypothetical protein
MFEDKWKITLNAKLRSFDYLNEKEFNYGIVLARSIT